MERLLTELVEKLQKAHREKLLSVVVYGSGATPEGKDRLSDYNVLCVLTQVTPEELAASETVFRWWREMKNPSPLLMSELEVRTSTDSFPLEFQDIRDRHRVIFGTDVVSDLEVDRKYYRAHVEHELRAKTLRLRQKAAGVLSDRDLLLRLMAESISTFCVLFRHAAVLAGEPPRYTKREAILVASNRFGFDATPFERLLDLREEKIKPKAISNVAGLFHSYLDGIRVVVEAVDKIDKQK
jgi:hypothetical protein